MAKRRTRKAKEEARIRRVEETNEGSSAESTKTESISAIAFTGEAIYLVKKDLLKTVLITAIIAILLFGIYLYLR